MAVEIVPGKVADVVDEALEITKNENPDKKEPELSDEGAFLIRRISEEVTKGIAALLNPPKDEDKNEDENEDENEKGKPRRKRQPPKPIEKKRNFFPNFFKR